MLAAPLAAAGVTAVPAAAATTYPVTATIGVGTEPVAVGVDPSTHVVYVANEVSGTVSVIDEATNTITATITIGVDSRPDGVGVDPSTHTVYVANEASGYDGTVSVIDEATNTITATISIGMGSDPSGVGVDPSTHTVYVANAGGNSVSVINGTTNTVTATIGLGSGSPFAVGVDPSTHAVYVADLYGGTVSVINGTTNTVTASIAVGTNPYGVGVDPSTHTVYVANAASYTVSVINEATNTVTATIAVGADPSGVGVDPSTETVYVTSYGSNTVSVINGATNAVTASISVGSGPIGVGVDPSAHAVYVANEGGNTVSVINGVTNTKSYQWAGYIATPKTGGASAFKYVTASFTVPAVNCAVTPNAEVYHFAGLGGRTEQYLDAAGIVEGCSGGTPYYYGAYWNESSFSSGPVDVLPVRPGDSVTGSVNFNASLGQDTFKVVDHTTGQSYQQALNCSCSDRSAEVITQGNLNNDGTADFGSVGFNTVKVTDSTQTGAKPMNNTAWTLLKVAEYGPVTGKVDVQPGTLTSTTQQSAFKNTWERQT